MILKYFMITTLFFLIQSNALNRNEICSVNEHVRAKCSRTLGYKCGNYCTINKSDCQKFSQLSFSLRKQRVKAIDFVKLRKFQAFLEQIQPCYSATTYKWNPSELCLNEIKCLYKKRVTFITGDTYLIKQSKCKCDEIGLEIQCGLDYCASSKLACDYFQNNLHKNASVLRKINKCKHKSEKSQRISKTQ